MDRLCFLDIDWKNYNYRRHIAVAQEYRPFLTVARDIESIAELPAILDEAWHLAEFSQNVIVVPKDPGLADRLDIDIPARFILGYSVQTRYGGTPIPPACFRRPTHLLGGRPDVQRRLAALMPIVSFDCNRFTLDAGFGDYFDGHIFRPHPVGGYSQCLAESIANITEIWSSYEVKPGAESWLKTATLRS
jgi:hypothetical protein